MQELAIKKKCLSLKIQEILLFERSPRKLFVPSLLFSYLSCCIFVSSVRKFSLLTSPQKAANNSHISVSSPSRSHRSIFLAAWQTPAPQCPHQTGEPQTSDLTVYLNFPQHNLLLVSSSFLQLMGFFIVLIYSARPRFSRSSSVLPSAHPPCFGGVQMLELNSDSFALLLTTFKDSLCPSERTPEFSVGRLNSFPSQPLLSAVYRESCPTGLALAAFCPSHANVLAISAAQPTILAPRPLGSLLLCLGCPLPVGQSCPLTKFQLTWYLAGDALPDGPSPFQNLFPLWGSHGKPCTSQPETCTGCLLHQTGSSPGARTGSCVLCFHYLRSCQASRWSKVFSGQKIVNESINFDLLKIPQQVAGFAFQECLSFQKLIHS